MLLQIEKKRKRFFFDAQTKIRRCVRVTHKIELKHSFVTIYKQLWAVS